MYENSDPEMYFFRGFILNFLSVNKKEEINWEDVKHIIISLINEFYSTGKEFIVVNEAYEEKNAVRPCADNCGRRARGIL